MQRDHDCASQTERPERIDFLVETADSEKPVAHHNRPLSIEAGAHLNSDHGREAVVTFLGAQQLSLLVRQKITYGVESECRSRYMPPHAVIC
ncbi:MAG: hypothetical protein EPN75_05705 [Beijerinckiaceae bacterium]|nr:MAG: hypothetical protein EPN75_05705 [Beijerinckiaceae bacterium]